MCAYKQYNLKIYCSVNLKFSVLHLYQMYMLLEKNMRGTQNSSNTLRHMEGNFLKEILNTNCTKHNKINMHFSHAPKHVNYNIWFE